MKYTKYAGLSLVALLAISGCDSSSNETEAENSSAKNTTITGTTTLSKSVVCIDTNNNNACDSDETHTEADSEGGFELSQAGELADGTNLVATGGYNLVLETDNTNSNGLTFRAAYNSNYDENNINVMTTLIAGKIDKGSTHSEAKAYYADKYSANGVTTDIVESDPLSLIDDASTQGLFLTIRAIEDGYVNGNDNVNAAPQFRETNSTDDNSTGGIITEDDADGALFGIDIFDFDLNAFIDRLSEYFDYFVNLVTCTFGLSGCDDNGTLAVVLTDAPGDYKAVYVTVDEIMVHKAGNDDTNESEDANATEDTNATETNAGWYSVATPHKTIDLLTLQNGITKALGEASLTTGKYTQLRFVLGDEAESNTTHPFANYLVFSDDNGTAELNVPSSTIKSNHNFEIIGGGLITMTIDFDANKSVKQAGGQWKLNPVLSIKTQAGAIDTEEVTE